MLERFKVPRGDQVRLRALPTRMSLNILSSHEKDSPDDDAGERQRCVGLAESNDDKGRSQKKRGDIEPPTCVHSTLLGK